MRQNNNNHSLVKSHIDELCIVVLNWNRRDDLLRLVDSIVDTLSYIPREQLPLVVVDNASTDDSVDQLRRRYPEATLIENPTNLGGSGGFNTGLQYAIDHDAKYVWLLDNDACVLPGALEGLLSAILESTDVAVVGSKILHADDLSVVSEAGARIKASNAGTWPMQWNTSNTESTKVLDVDYVAACSLLACVSCVREVGLLDQAYFLLWDDMDWGVRFKRHGYRVVAAMSSEVAHPGFSERRITPAFLYYAARNHLYFVDCNYKGLKRLYYLSLITGVQRSHERLLRREGFHRGWADAIGFGVDDFYKGWMGKFDKAITTERRSGAWMSTLPDKPLSGRALLFVDAPVGVIKAVVRRLGEDYPDLQVSLIGAKARQLLFRDYEYFPHKGGLLGMMRYGWLLKEQGMDYVIRFDEVRCVHYHFFRPQIVISTEGNSIGLVPASRSAILRSWLGDVTCRLIGLASGFVEGLYLGARRRRHLSQVQG